MSLNVNTIYVGDKCFTLRLTSKSLMNFNLKHGQKGTSPLVAVLDATNDIESRIDLLTNALNHPDNHNDVKNGADLLDLMADSGSWPPEEINGLILNLAYESGLISENDRFSLIDPVANSGKQLVAALSDLLQGKPVGAGNDEPQEGAGENPT